MNRLYYSGLRHGIIIMLTAFLAAACGDEDTPYVEDIGQAQMLLEKKRSEVRDQLEKKVNPEQLRKAVNLGLWKEAAGYLDTIPNPDNAFKLVEAQLLIKKHRYKEAGENIQEVLNAAPENRRARLMQARLAVQAWNLEEAADIARRLLDGDKKDARAGHILGEIALLNRRQEEALEWARKIQDWGSGYAGGYLLEAEVQFWKQDPGAAESALRRALQLEPFNADARFSYGYAIWRRVDATQLDDMAGQWNLALEVNPLHYLTNWHFGNGHTNLTYADYAQPSDSAVNARLDKADSLVAAGKVEAAISMTREVEAGFPKSVLPATMRGSVFYMDNSMNRAARLDSAQAIFRSVLDQKQNYGSAHNGLAAVIKKRQFSYLEGYQKLEKAIAETEIPEKGSVFYNVFKDANYYPGDRVKKMIAQQIGPSRAYLPMINKFGSDFAIPPLHVDLAEAMDNGYFRHATTFDNRQWMDIRGVGSGATGIEYLERGAHWERNVLAHEYAHLYHGRILTDKESRRIRALYYDAMQDGQALDYYASNNESEYFAQGYAGFLSMKKVHPLNHKSMNTRRYIRNEDPALYAFLDSLLTKQRVYLQGEEQVFAGNWAQTHLSLSGRYERRGQTDKAAAHLDTALAYSSDYLPALLAYAELEARQGDFQQSDKQLARARQLDSGYAPVYLSEANAIHQKVLQEKMAPGQAIEEQQPLLSEAFEKETDLSVRARVNGIHRRRLRDYGKIAGAIKAADRYLEDAPTVSTYLRDRKEQAEAFKYYLRSSMGYFEKPMAYFKELVDQNPQNFDYRRMYADVLKRAGQQEEALHVLEEGRRILQSANENRPDYTLRIGRLYASRGDTVKARREIENIDPQQLDIENRLLLADVYLKLGDFAESRSVLDHTEQPVLPAEVAALSYVKARLASGKGELKEAVQLYRAALEHNPYHRDARQALAELLDKQVSEKAAEKLREEGMELGLKARD